MTFVRNQSGVWWRYIGNTTRKTSKKAQKKTSWWRTHL